MHGLVCLLSVFLGAAPMVSAGQTFFFSDHLGLAAEAEFTLLTPTTLRVRLQNTSTAASAGLDSASQILTGISWDFGLPGVNPGDAAITGGTGVIGPNSSTVNFDTGSYGPGFDVSGEYGFGNAGGSGALINSPQFRLSMGWHVNTPDGGTGF